MAQFGHADPRMTLIRPGRHPGVGEATQKGDPNTNMSANAKCTLRESYLRLRQREGVVGLSPPFQLKFAWKLW